MNVQRFPTTLALAALALIFSSISIIADAKVTPLITALIIIQALSLITSPSHPCPSAAAFIISFAVALLVGHSTGIEIFLGVFLITAITATGHFILSTLIAVSITLGGFYSPLKSRIEFDPVALIIFLTIITLAYLLGFWIQHNYQQRLASQCAQQDQRKQLTRLLHDTIAADLTSLIVQLEKLAITTPERHTELKNTACKARDSLNNVRQLLTALNTQSDTSPTPNLPTTLEELTQRLRDHDFTVTTTVDLTTPVTTTLHNIALERVANEAITNIIKHGTARSAVTIDATSDDQGVTFTATNLHTFTKQKDSASDQFGLTGMLNTLHAVKGTLTTCSDNEKWILTAHIPFREANRWYIPKP